MLYKRQKSIRGFTLIETLVGVAIFLMVALAFYQSYQRLFALVQANQYKITAINLANEQFEIIRNMPYAYIGVSGGVPSGPIEHVQELLRSGVLFVATTTIRNVDLPEDGLIGGNPNDLSPADNKLVEIEIGCPSCASFSPVILSTRIAPKNLESASTNGALFVKVFDANGVPLSGADVNVQSLFGTTTLNVNDITDVNGNFQIIDIEPGNDRYQVTVSKSGYSTDRTYTTTELSGSSPVKPPPSIFIQQVTQTSFAIDRVSDLNVTTVSPFCAEIPNISFDLRGSKKNGTSPDVYKYNQTFSTDGSGSKAVNNLEWDNYNLSINSNSYDVIGINPLNPIQVNPNTDQDVQIVLIPRLPKTLLVTVKDSSTLLPITNANVLVTKSGFSEDKITGRGYLTQTDWSGGVGNDYFGQDGNVDDTNAELKLLESSEIYYPSGILESNVFNTGSPSNFHQIFWLPESQNLNTGNESVLFQITSSSTNSGPWIYRGPDGATSTFYTFSGQSINDIHDNDRYFKYKLFLETEDTGFTPIISDVSLTFTTDCTPPGQVYFNNLSAGTYTIEASKTGYSTSTVIVPISDDWTEQEIILYP